MLRLLRFEKPIEPPRIAPIASEPIARIMGDLYFLLEHQPAALPVIARVIANVARRFRQSSEG